MTYTEKDVEERLNQLEIECGYSDIKRLVISAELTEELAFYNEGDEEYQCLIDVRNLNDWRHRLEKMEAMNQRTQ